MYRKTLKPKSPELTFYSYYKGLAGFSEKQNIAPQYYLGIMTEEELTKLCFSNSAETRVPRIIKRRNYLV